jgi:hypothetical protein
MDSQEIVKENIDKIKYELLKKDTLINHERESELYF